MRIVEKVAQCVSSGLRKPEVSLPAMLFAAWVMFFSDLIFTSKNLYFRDILNFHYPLRKILVDSYARWELPLWNPFVYLGQPMLANPNYMAFYPTTLFHLILPFEYAFKLHFIIHPLLGGLGLYFLLRRLGIVPLASFGGSLIYEFSGSVLSFLNLYNIVQAVALMPWIAWAFLGVLQERSLRRSVLFALLLALLIITCEPLLIQGCVGLLASLALFYFLESEDRRGALLRILRAGTLGGFLGLALAAIQVLPTLELLQRSARFEGYGFTRASQWSMQWLELLNIAVPHLLGNPYTLSNFTYWGEFLHSGREGYLVSFFLGGGSILMCGLSLFSLRKNLRIMNALLATLSLTLALGHNLPVYRWLYDFVPGFSLGRFPSKYFLLTTIALAILAALGIEVVIEMRNRSRRTRSRVVLVACGGVIAGLCFWGMLFYNSSNPEYMISQIRAHIDPGVLTVKNFGEIFVQLQASIRFTAIFLTLASLMVILAVLTKGASYAGILIMMVLAAELMPSNLRLVPLLSEENVNFVPEVNIYLEKELETSLHRVVPLDNPGYMPTTIWAPNQSWVWLTYYLRRSGQPMYGLINRIQYSLTFPVDDLNTKESNELYKRLLSLSIEEGFSLLGKLNSRIVLTIRQIPERDGGVKLLSSFPTQTTEASLNAYELKDYLPRAYFVPVAEIIADEAEALARISQPEFDPWKSVVLQSHPGEAASGRGVGTVTITNYESARVVCEVEATTAGFLVLLDSHYPGWQAYIDGEPAGILRANYAFRAVEVTEGRHRVEFVYRPRSFYIGAGLSFAALLLGLVLILKGRRGGT